MLPFQIDLTNENFCRDLKQACRTHPSLPDDLIKLFESLEQNPDYWPWIPGVGVEVRKARVGIKSAGIGKSGGYRLIYFVDREAHVIVPLILHFKPYVAMVPSPEIAKVVKSWFEKHGRESAEMEKPSSGPPN